MVKTGLGRGHVLSRAVVLRYVDLGVLLVTCGRLFHREHTWLRRLVVMMSLFTVTFIGEIHNEKVVFYLFSVQSCRFDYGAATRRMSKAVRWLVRQRSIATHLLQQYFLVLLL